ncbi:hypothetical protein DPMN_031995 [Dreissena polymorpha]|uniref:Peptidase S1 domain-containing protein n=2 Tax=Dreissena polymorpha TaxID=45954 RepID=A0A9D4M5P6_DREPO|nr:hypothetical protein DPMN_031995 [Dreissena polymorpha]
MHGTEVTYSNLIVVNQLNECEFACPGDSGAPVFVKDGDGENVCIGLLLGGIPGCGPYYVIPIEKILNDIGITKLKSFSPSNAELGRSIEKVEQNINKKIDKLEQKIVELLLKRST